MRSAVLWKNMIINRMELYKRLFFKGLFFGTTGLITLFHEKDEWPGSEYIEERKEISDARKYRTDAGHARG